MKNKILFIIICILMVGMLGSCSKKTKELTTVTTTTVTTPKIYRIYYYDSGKYLTSSTMEKDLYTPTKEGYKFLGWYKDKQLTEPYEHDKNLKENVYLYAKWIEEYHIDFDSCGGTKIDSQIVLGTTSKVIEPEEPIREGYEFLGWYKDPYFFNRFFFDFNVRADFTLYAKWEPVNKTDYTFYFPFTGMMIDKTYNNENTYSNSYFYEDPIEFNKDLALLSFSGAQACNNANVAKAYLNSLYFEDITLSQTYYQASTKDTVAYSIGHKNIGDKELLVLIPRGHSYGKEWANNFVLGLEGDHNGWVNKRDVIYNALVEYIDKYLSDKEVVLWMMGYSRGAAITNLLYKKIIDDNLFSKEEVFAYTFGTPQGNYGESDEYYIHNVINDGDIFSCLAPSTFGFNRIGIDYNLGGDLKQIVHSFDKDIEIIDFNPSSKYSNVQEYADYFLDLLIKDLFISREEYFNTYETYVTYALDFFYGLSQGEKDKLNDALNIKSLILEFALMKEEDLFKKIKSGLDKSNITYDSQKIEKICSIIFGLKEKTLLNEAIKNSNNIMCLVQMHTPEVYYALLLNSEK